MKVKIVTLGCKVNIYESEYILSCFKDKGYEITNAKADIYIVNTCSVTNTSDSKSRKIINRLIRENPGSVVVVVMGCMIEANHDFNLPGISILIGNKDKARVVELVEEYLSNKKQIVKVYKDFDKEFEDMFITNMASHTRAFVKIQDGCENFCSYCIIPYTRGRQRSKKEALVLDEITNLVENGYKEVVLTGIHTGHYGSDLKTSFPELLKKIVLIPNLKRLRISSIEITELNEEFLKVFQTNPIIVSHLHVPLQSGSDIVLQAMNRKYLTDYFLKKVETLRQIRPDISITTDIIVGFPGETEELFKETLEFVKKIKFTKVHVFPYSRRKGTKADLMENQVPENIKKERVKILIDLSNQLEQEYLDSYLGKTVEVLIEESQDFSTGHTGNYLKVIIDKHLASNNFYKVKILEREGLTLKGQLEDNEGN